LASPSALDALVAQRDAEFGAHVLGDGPIAHALRPKRLHLGERSLLVLFLDQGAIVTDFPAERWGAAKVLPGALLMALGYPKGVSGNPSGMSRFYFECRQIFQEASPDAPTPLQRDCAGCFCPV
jgi:hypothetical protein